MRRIFSLALALLLTVDLAWAGSGPGGFPLPKDAGPAQAAPGGGGKIQVFQCARGRDAVVAEVRAALSSDGWKITSDATSPRGAVRLTVQKGGTELKVSLTGNGDKTAIILTLP